ncbi:MAG: RsmE family RNA methyltransferase [Candidatus Omnitrophota bacterium]
MSKIRIYIQPEKVENFIEISGKNTIHKLRNVLRLGRKNELFVFDGQGKEYLYAIKDISRKQISLKKVRESLKECFPEPKVILAFPVTKEEKINFILQKATELGVSEFIPFTCQRSFKISSLSNKLMRWEKIVIEAARQSGRLWLPPVNNILSFNKVIEKCYQVKLAASIKGDKLKSVLNTRQKEIFIIVGPEGDFTPAEWAKLRENNFKFIKLSINLLRMETAAVFAAGLVNYFFNQDVYKT